MGSQRRINMLQVFPAVSCVHSGPRRSPRSPSVPHGPPWSPVVPSGPQWSPGHSEISTSWNIASLASTLYQLSFVVNFHRYMRSPLSPAIPSRLPRLPLSPAVPSRPQPSPAHLSASAAFARRSSSAVACVLGRCPLRKQMLLSGRSSTLHPLVRQINLEEKAVRARDAAPAADRL